MRLSCLAFAALLVTACSGPDAEPAPTIGHWSPKGLQRREWGLYAKEYVPLELPEARHASADPRDGGRRFLLNVLQAGTLVFKGTAWRLSSTMPEERAAALSALQAELTRLLQAPEMRAADATSRVPVYMHADRQEAFDDIAMLLRLVRDPPVRTQQWRISVRASTFPGDAHIGGRFDAAPVADDALPLRIVTTRVPGAGTRHVLEVAGRTFDFGVLGGPAGASPYADAEFLARANALWNGVEAHLASNATEAREARILLAPSGAGPALLWVVKALDLLVGAGVERVAFPDAGLGLTLDPPDAPPLPPAPSSREMTAVVVFWVVLGALVALTVTLLGRRGTRKG